MRPQSDSLSATAKFAATDETDVGAGIAASPPVAYDAGVEDLPPLPWPAMPHGQFDFFSAAQMRDYARIARADAQAEVERLLAISHTPHNDEFYQGVSIEEEYQRQLHGVDDTDARFDWDQYSWVARYLLNKALMACISGEGNGEKAKHHLVTTAALLKNWHNVLTGKPAASVHSNRGHAVAQRLAAADGAPAEESHG
ncbi:hypothetical protein [Burkholderia gladioli]|uniref:hypothetical protein n=1 Tax=Burkholderia gladioli TaxID=28095 RepID=UPI001640F146|nr:hypothetical protein [Burkholderia gladioli]